MRFELQHVHYMPKELRPGILYVSQEFETAAHLCACGCGMKVRTPLGPTEWTLKEEWEGPSLYPSIGNWQQPCQSHYWITRGEACWSTKWTPEQIAAGWQRDQQLADAYYTARKSARGGALRNLCRWIAGFFK